MYYIYRDDIDNYRFTIGKICFLKSYSEYELINDTSLEKSNCMRVTELIPGNGGTREVVISLFSTPNAKKIKYIETVKRYYQAGRDRKATKQKESKKVNILSQEFDNIYNHDFKLAIENPEEYFGRLDDGYKPLFKNILYRDNKKEYGSDRLKYKYFAQRTFKPKNEDEEVKGKDRAKELLDGDISFVSPSTFNDPFDVNCFFENGVDISNMFRIFCVAPDQYEILMWSYYGEEHKGYCFEYDENDIIQAILNEKRKGICIIGDVKYSNKRPQQKSVLNKISISELKFYEKAAFTKFEEWGHEKERRYVMIFTKKKDEETASDQALSSNQDIEESPYWVYKIPLLEVYEGCNGEGIVLQTSAGKTITPIKVKKDDADYLLKNE